jgi:zinc-ribbon domain
MSFCSSCGKELRSGSKFCDGCGFAVDQAVTPDEPEVYSAPKKQRIAYVALVVVVALVAVFVYFKNNGGNADISDCTSLASSVIKTSESGKSLITVLDITNAVSFPIPASQAETGWTTNFSCQGQATLSNGTNTLLDFQDVSDPNGKEFVKWQPDILNK